MAQTSIKSSMQAWIMPIFLLILAATQSCQKKDVMCYQPTEATAKIGFGQRLILDVDTFIDSVLVDTTFLVYRDTTMPYLQAFYDDGVNSFVVNAGEASNVLTLLLNPNSSETTYYISTDSLTTDRDTMKVIYNNKPVFISNECGYTNFYTITDVQWSSSSIDSMHIRDAEVTLDNANNKRHVMFYYFND